MKTYNSKKWSLVELAIIAAIGLVGIGAIYSMLDTAITLLKG